MAIAPAPSAGQVISLRVTVRAPDLETFVEKYAKHLHGDRIFIFTKAPQPVGTRVRFTLQLSTGEQLIQGKGTVTRVQADSSDRRRPPGMELVFVALDDRSQTLVDFMLASRAGDELPLVRAVQAPELPPARAPLAAILPPPSPKQTPEMTTPAPLKLSPWELAARRQATPSADPPSLQDLAAAESSTEPSDPSPRPASIALKLAEKLGPKPVVSEVTPGPTPAFAEKWRDPLPPGPPAAGTDANVPANPFSEISDGAIEYFVEWSLDQSIGPAFERTAKFSNVPMALAAEAGTSDEPVKKLWWHNLRAVAGIAFGMGTLTGVGLTLVLRGSPPPPAMVATRAASVPVPPSLRETTAADQPAKTTTPTEAAVPSAKAPSASAPSPVKAAPVAAEAAGEVGSLTILTRPAGAQVTVDGKPAGVSPATLQLPPGKHSVTLTKERYAAVNTNTDAPGELAVDLKRPPAELHITSTPRGAEVVIAGVPRGHTPASVRLPRYESYDVQVNLAGAKPWRKSVYVKTATSAVQAALILAAPAKKPPPRVGPPVPPKTSAAPPGKLGQR